MAQQLNYQRFKRSKRGEKINAAWKIRVGAHRIETDHDGPELTQLEPLLSPKPPPPPEATTLSPVSADMHAAQSAWRQVGCGINIALTSLTCTSTLHFESKNRGGGGDGSPIPMATAPDKRGTILRCHSIASIETEGLTDTIPSSLANNNRLRSRQ